MKTLTVIDWVLVSIVAVLSFIRLFYFDSGEGVVLTSESIFKIGAHAIVFGLIGAWMVSRYWLYGILAIVFTAVEVLAFFVV